MSASNQILIAARRSLIVLGVAVTITVGVFFGVRYLTDREGNQMLQLQQQEAQAQATLEQKQADATTLQEGMRQFDTLRQQGLVGVPQREGWVEQLPITREQMGLPPALTYILQPAKPLTQQDAESAPVAVEPQDAAGAAPSGPVFHDLEFQISGIHEGELLAFLAAYQSQVKGRFRVNACSLTAPLETGLTAACTLRFFTLPLPVAKAEAP